MADKIRLRKRPQLVNQEKPDSVLASGPLDAPKSDEVGPVSPQPGKDGLVAPKPEEGGSDTPCQRNHRAAMAVVLIGPTVAGT